MRLCRALHKDDILPYYPYLIAAQYRIIVPAKETEKSAAAEYDERGYPTAGNIQLHIVYEAESLSRYHIYDFFPAYLIEAHLQVTAPSYIIYVYQRWKKNSSGV